MKKISTTRKKVKKENVWKKIYFFAITLKYSSVHSALIKQDNSSRKSTYQTMLLNEINGNIFQYYAVHVMTLHGDKSLNISLETYFRIIKNSFIHLYIKLLDLNFMFAFHVENEKYVSMG